MLDVDDCPLVKAIFGKRIKYPEVLSCTFLGTVDKVSSDGVFLGLGLGFDLEDPSLDKEKALCQVSVSYSDFISSSN